MTVKYYDICTNRNDAKQIERYYKEINPLHTENNLNHLSFLEISNLDIFNVAYHIIKQRKENNLGVDYTSLSALLYLIQKEFIKVFNRPLFKEDFEVFNYGPAISKVHCEFSGKGDLTKIDKIINSNHSLCTKDNKDIILIIDNVLDKYNMCGVDIVDVVTKNNSPWALLMYEYKAKAKRIPKILM